VVLRSDVLRGILAALVPHPRALTRPPDAPVRIAVLGDSLALGTGASRADGGFIFRAFRALLAQRPGSRIDNVAIGGATVADVLRLEVARLAGIRYDVVIVCVGGNDVVRGTSATAFRTTYTALLRRIGELTPTARLICCGVPDVSVSPIFADERIAIHRLAVNDDRAVRAAASAADALFADLFAVTRRTHDADHFLGRDRFHPSDAGYVLLEQALRPLLQQAAT
jgi:lysophospholipase L1-like esterase